MFDFLSCYVFSLEHFNADKALVCELEVVCVDYYLCLVHLIIFVERCSQVLLLLARRSCSTVLAALRVVKFLRLYGFRVSFMALAIVVFGALRLRRLSIFHANGISKGWLAPEIPIPSRVITSV